jgi:hypothetical protein
MFFQIFFYKKSASAQEVASAGSAGVLGVGSSVG